MLHIIDKYNQVPIYRHLIIYNPQLWDSGCSRTLFLVSAVEDGFVYVWEDVSVWTGSHAGFDLRRQTQIRPHAWQVCKIFLWTLKVVIHSALLAKGCAFIEVQRLSFIVHWWLTLQYMSFLFSADWLKTSGRKGLYGYGINPERLAARLRSP